MKILFQILFFCFKIKFILNHVCMRYYNFCIQCNEKSNLCDYCFFSVFKPDLEGGCIGAKKCIPEYNLCLECNQDLTLCQKCEEGYSPDNNGGCTFTKNCDVSFRGSCQTCLQNFSLVNDGKPYLECKKLPKEEDRSPYCKKYNEEGICEECLDNYFLTHGNKKCTQIFYCNYLEKEKCIECIPGFYLDKKDNNICKSYNDKFFYCKESEDGEKCSLCREGFYLSQNNKCVITPHCIESKPNTYYCQKCEDNFYLTLEGSCSITEHCKNIISPQLGKCYICEKNYYLNTETGFCKSNQEDNIFKYCEKGSEFCESCIIYYYLGEDNKCSKSKNCSESIDGTCIQCSEGTFLTKNNKCAETDNCILVDDYYKCIECETGFYYNTTSNECINDEDNDEKFKNCKNLDIAGKKCFECRNNYYLNKTDNKCYLSQENEKLIKCAEINEQEMCIKCEKNYYLGNLDNKCSSIYGCYKSENSEKCIECSPNYCLTNGKCNYTEIIPENSVGFCYKCLETNENGKGCKKCFDGFSLSENGFCQNFDYCEEKKDNECLKCKQNYKDEYGFNLSFCINEIFGCVEINNDNCLRCDDIYDLDKCTKCFEGYRVEDGKCVKCKEGCAECTDEKNCGSCLEGYFVKNKENIDNYNVECEKCLKGCQKCINDFECEQCSYGYYLSNQKNPDGILECVQCSEGCKICYDDNYCLECENGYELVNLEEDKIVCQKK